MPKITSTHLTVNDHPRSVIVDESHKISIVLGTISLSRTIVEDYVDAGQNENVRSVLRDFEDQCEASESRQAFREITVFEDPDRGEGASRFLGAECGNCSNGDGSNECVRKGKHEAGTPARLHVVMVDSEGDQISATERRTISLSEQTRTSLASKHIKKIMDHVDQPKIPIGSIQVGSDEDAPDSATACNIPIYNPLVLKLKPKEGKPFAKLSEFAKERKADERALCLTVRFGHDSFPRPSYSTAVTRLDIKIDVYCNGEYVGCSLVGSRASQKSNSHELVHRFHGRRTHRVGEYPWVLPVGQQRNGKAEGSAAAAIARWQEVARGIEHEAEMHSLSPDGKRNHLRKFLEDLAKLPVDRQIIERHIETGHRFGVIDVVLTLGRGKKDGPSGGYLTKPQNMKLGELTKDRKQWLGISRRSANDTQKVLPKGKTSKLGKSSQIKEQFSDIQTPKPKRCAPVSPKPVNKRRRIDQDPSLSPEMQSTTSRTRRSGLLGEFSDMGLTEEQQIDYLTKKATNNAQACVTLRTDIGQSSMAPPITRAQVSLSSSPQPSITRTPGPRGFGSPDTDDSSMLSETTTPPSLKPICVEAVTQLAQTPKKPRSEQEDPMKSSWMPGTVHENSVVSYYTDRMRQVKTERTGNFQEESILFGVRYVVF